MKLSLIADSGTFWVAELIQQESRHASEISLARLDLVAEPV